MIRSIYLYAVSIITLVMAITGGVMLFNSVADFVAPSVYTQSYSEYAMYTKTDVRNELSDTEMRSSYEQYVSDEKERVRNNAINQLISSIGLIAISLPIFFLFQRKVTHERKEPSIH